MQQHLPLTTQAVAQKQPMINNMIRAAGAVNAAAVHKPQAQPQQQTQQQPQQVRVGGATLQSLQMQQKQQQMQQQQLMARNTQLQRMRFQQQQQQQQQQRVGLVNTNKPVALPQKPAEPVHPNRLGGREPIFMHKRLYDALQAKQAAAQQKAAVAASAAIDPAANTKIGGGMDVSNSTSASSKSKSKPKRAAGTTKKTKRVAGGKKSKVKATKEGSSSASRNAGSSLLDFGQSSASVGGSASASVGGCNDYDYDEELGGAGGKKKKTKKRRSHSRAGGSTSAGRAQRGGWHTATDQALADSLVSAGANKKKKTKRRGKAKRSKASRSGGSSRSHSKSRSSKHKASARKITYSRHVRPQSRRGGDNEMNALVVRNKKKKSKQYIGATQQQQQQQQQQGEYRAKVGGYKKQQYNNDEFEEEEQGGGEKTKLGQVPRTRLGRIQDVADLNRYIEEARLVGVRQGVLRPNFRVRREVTVDDVLDETVRKISTFSLAPDESDVFPDRRALLSMPHLEDHDMWRAPKLMQQNHDEAMQRKMSTRRCSILERNQKHREMTLTFANLLTLFPERWLDSVVLDAYLHILQEHWPLKQLLYLNSAEKDPNFNEIKTTPPCYEYILSVLYLQYHWTVIMVNNTNKSIRYLNSQVVNQQTPKQQTKPWREVFTEYSLRNYTHAQQCNQSDCGVYSAAWAMMFLYYDDAEMDKIRCPDMAAFRHRMLIQILLSMYLIPLQNGARI